LTHNWGKHAFRIEYEILDNFRSVLLDDRLLSNWIREFFEVLNQSANPLYENNLYITLELVNDQIHLLFHYNGSLVGPSDIISWLKEKEGNPFFTNIQELSDSEMVVDVFLRLE